MSEQFEYTPYDFLDFPERYHWIMWKDDAMIVTFDLETTGLAPGSKIIQIAAQCHEGEELIDELVTYVNPEEPLSEETTRITGIIDEDVQSAPTWAEVVHDFHSFLSMADMYCGHNIYSFDLPFLVYKFDEHGLTIPRRAALDTQIWAVIYNIKHSSSVLKGSNQGAIASKYGCAKMTEVAHGEAGLHNALVDIEVNFELRQRMSKDLITDEELLIVMEKQAEVLPIIFKAKERLKKRKK